MLMFITSKGLPQFGVVQVVSDSSGGCASEYQKFENMCISERGGMPEPYYVSVYTELYHNVQYSEIDRYGAVRPIVSDL